MKKSKPQTSNMLTSTYKVIGQKMVDRKNSLFLFFWLLTILVYLPAYKGGFYEDFLSFAEGYQKLPLIDFLNLTPSSLYQGVNMVHYVFLQLFGLSPIPWFLLFTGLHALNATLIFHFFRSLFSFSGLKNPNETAFFGVLIWLLSPVVCEVVIWKACSHYLVSTGLMFLILNLLISWLRNPKGKYNIAIIILYILSTVMLELFYLTPAFVFITILTLRLADKIDKHRSITAIKRIFIPLILVWCLYYLALNQITHQTTARADFDLSLLASPSYIISKLCKFPLYIIFMEFFLPSAKRAYVHRFTEYPVTIICAGILFLTYTLWGFVKFKTWAVTARSLFTLFLLTGTSCIIILPMWFHDQFVYQGSRYYYLPSIFFYMLLAALLVQGEQAKRIRYFFLAVYILTCLVGTSVLVKGVRNATKIFTSLIKNFRWQDEKEVFLLNLPTLQNGVAIIGAGSPSNFAYHLNIFRKDTLKAEIYDVSSYNMVGRWDGAHVTVQDSITLKVTLNQYGSWWWYNGFGAADYENERYKVTFIDNGFSYLLQLKQKPGAGTVILFQSGEAWKEVNMTKLNEEQW